MWTPDPSWTPLPSARGVWRAERGGRAWVVKRLWRPWEDAGAEMGSQAWWRREADVAGSGVLRDTPGLRAPEGHLEEDDSGITLWSREQPREPVEPARTAEALGAFSDASLPAAGWWCRRLLRERVSMVERRGGWTALARTDAAGLAAQVWDRRAFLLARLDAMRQVPAHGDLVPGNVLRHDGGWVVACDWSVAGTAAAGVDLGFVALSSGIALAPLLDAWHSASSGLDDPEEVALAARTALVLTVLTRTDRALGATLRASAPAGAGLGHPAVAPYLRALRASLPDVRALVED